METDNIIKQFCKNRFKMLPTFVLDLFRENYKPDITTNFLDELDEKAEYLEIQKGEILFTDKDPRKTFLIISGSLVQFVITPEGEEKAIMFHTESFLPFSGNTFFGVEESSVHHFARVNEDIKVVVIPYDFVVGAVTKYPFFAQKVYLKTLLYIQTLNRLQNQVIGLTSLEFLEWLLEHYSFLFQRFKSQDIASFMGITPTWLSNLKLKVYKK